MRLTTLRSPEYSSCPISSVTSSSYTPSLSFLQYRFHTHIISQSSFSHLKQQKNDQAHMLPMKKRSLDISARTNPLSRRRRRGTRRV